mgnify:FL=1
MNINDRELLARTLQAEAGNQGFGGMMAAGSVIMNRTNAAGYGNGLRGVILKPGQFSAWNSRLGPDGKPVYAGGAQGQDMANMRASDDAYKAADALITGGYEDKTGGATHYYNPSISNPDWGRDKAGGDWKQIGDHVFGFADASKKPNPNQAIADDTLRALGKSPKGILAPTQTSETETKPMMQQQKPRGLLERLGVQKMEEGAEGEAGQRFYNRESFGDTLANLAPALGRMGVMGLDVPAQAMANSRREDKLVKAATEKAKAQDNATGQWLIRNGFKAIGEGVLKGELSGAAGLQMSQVAKKPTKVATAIEEFEYAKVNKNLPEGVTSLPEYKKYIARAGRNVPDVTMHPTLNRPLSPIEVSVDNEIAKTFGETVTTGLGAANRNAATIKSVLDRLGSTEEGEALTGPSKGMLGSFGRNVFAPTSQAALNDVSAVVQQSLREILGGQFAQKEGEQLIARAYDISAPPPVNAARLRALYTQLESIAENKAALIDYVEKYGTSAGFSGTTVTPSVDVFYNAMDRAVPQVGPEQGPLLPGQTYTDQELEDAMANFKKSKGGVKQ